MSHKLNAIKIVCVLTNGKVLLRVKRLVKLSCFTMNSSKTRLIALVLVSTSSIQSKINQEAKFIIYRNIDRRLHVGVNGDRHSSVEETQNPFSQIKRISSVENRNHRGNWPLDFDVTIKINENKQLISINKLTTINHKDNHDIHYSFGVACLIKISRKPFECIIYWKQSNGTKRQTKETNHRAHRRTIFLFSKLNVMWDVFKVWNVWILTSVWFASISWKTNWEEHSGRRLKYVFHCVKNQILQTAKNDDNDYEFMVKIKMFDSQFVFHSVYFAANRIINQYLIATVRQLTGLGLCLGVRAFSILFLELSFAKRNRIDTSTPMPSVIKLTDWKCERANDRTKFAWNKRRQMAMGAEKSKWIYTSDMVCAEAELVVIALQNLCASFS